MKNRHLISVDELRAAGALDVPAARRKSLGAQAVQRDLFSGLVGDGEAVSEEQPPALGGAEGDESADERE